MLGAVLRNLQQLQQQLHHLGPSATAALQAVAKSPGIAIGCAGGLGSAGTASLARFASLSNLTAWPCTAWPSEHDLLRCLWIVHFLPGWQISLCLYSMLCHVVLLQLPGAQPSTQLAVPGPFGASRPGPMQVPHQAVPLRGSTQMQLNLMLVGLLPVWPVWCFTPATIMRTQPHVQVYACVFLIEFAHTCIYTTHCTRICRR